MNTIEEFDHYTTLKSLSNDELISMMLNIEEAFFREYPTATAVDQSVIFHEEVRRVFAGMSITDADAQTFAGKMARKENLQSSIHALTDKINGLKGSLQNELLLRSYYVLMLNGRGGELEKTLRNRFPDYFM